MSVPKPDILFWTRKRFIKTDIKVKGIQSKVQYCQDQRNTVQIIDNEFTEQDACIVVEKLSEKGQQFLQ